MSVNCEILFDQDRNSENLPKFCAGDTIRGKFLLMVDCDSFTLERITIKLKGSGFCRWLPRLYSFCGFTGREKYVDYVQVLVDSRKVYLKGFYTIPFSIILPFNIPSSINEDFGYILYELSADVKEFNGSTLNYASIISIVNNVDLSIEFPTNKLPCNVTDTYKDNFLFCAMNKMIMNVKLSKSAFVKGQVIQVETLINHSDVTCIVISLVKVVTYRSTKPWGKSKETTKVVKKALCANPLMETSDGYQKYFKNLKIPINIPPTSVNNAVLKISYEIHVESMFTMWLGPFVKIPVIIGTIPYSEDDLLPSLESREYVRQRAPPSYEEVMRSSTAV